MSINIKKIFGLLQGHWIIDRTMTAATGTSLGKFKGKASFAFDQKESVLFYKEEGETQFPDNSFAHAYNTYVYKSNNKENELEVYFDEKPLRFFHCIEWKKSQDSIIGEGTPHTCSKDIYQLYYQLFSRNFFFISCQVTGPKKNYNIHTKFSRKK